MSILQVIGIDVNKYITDRTFLIFDYVLSIVHISATSNFDLADIRSGNN